MIKLGGKEGDQLTFRSNTSLSSSLESFNKKLVISDGVTRLPRSLEQEIRIRKGFDELGKRTLYSYLTQDGFLSPTLCQA